MIILQLSLGYGTVQSIISTELLGAELDLVPSSKGSRV